MGQESNKKRVVLSRKETKKGNSFQGRVNFGRSKVMTAFVMCNSKGEPEMYRANDGTDLMYVQLHFFNNTQKRGKSGDPFS